MQFAYEHFDRFYLLLQRLADAPGQGRTLREVIALFQLPKRGVYFFFENGEYRTGQPLVKRVVRVGTHAVSTGSKSTLRQRLKQHIGTRSGGGNHRGSIFRLHIGAALLARNGSSLPTWGLGSSAPPALTESETLRAAEAMCEKQVSEYIGEMPILWLDVPDEASPLSDRSFIERNVIALLSNKFNPIDSASTEWLGHFSPRQEIRNSAIWNLNYCADNFDPIFLDKFESLVNLTIEQCRNQADSHQS
jgi:hypothetical protein